MEGEREVTYLTMHSFNMTYQHILLRTRNVWINGMDGGLTQNWYSMRLTHRKLVEIEKLHQTCMQELRPYYAQFGLLHVVIKWKISIVFTKFCLFSL